jgi:hypothetical protein
MAGKKCNIQDIGIFHGGSHRCKMSLFCNKIVELYKADGS